MGKASKLDIVIPAAGMGRRMKSFGAKALLPVGPETLIGRQIRLLREAYPTARVTVVVGHEGDRVRRALPPGVRVVVNRDFATTNVARSLYLGLAGTSPNKPALLVYGDLVFNRRAVEGIRTDASSVLVDPGAARPEEVGVNVTGGMAVHFSYGLEAKWAQIAMLAPHEKRLFVGHAGRPAARRLFGFEVLNHVLAAGGEFRAVTNPHVSLAEIDTSRDIDLARRITA